jgi:cAMP-specific phosphodiesterase 4
MDLVVHAADVSVPCRPDFELVREWTYLLFDEFFYQGDQELKESLSISFLCDRKTTNVAKS